MSAADDADREAIAEHLSKLRSAWDKDEPTKRTIILQAADLLAIRRYQSDPRKVAAALTKILCRDRRLGDHEDDGVEHAICSKGYLMDVLPEQYKRVYESTPCPTDIKGDVESWLAAATIVGHLSYKVAAASLKQMRLARGGGKQGDSVWKEMNADGVDALAGLDSDAAAHAKKLKGMGIPEFSDWAAECADAAHAMAKAKDGRQKLSTLTKVNLSAMLAVNSTARVARALKKSGAPVSAKWLKAIKEDDDLYAFKSLVHCPACGADTNAWMDAAERAIKNHTDIPPFKPATKKGGGD